MTKKIAFLVLAFSLILLTNLSFALVPPPPVTTLATQPPAAASDCTGYIDSGGVGWIQNGYVKVSFNTTTSLDNMTFYRDTTKILTLDFTQSYINATPSLLESPITVEIPLTFYKIEWYNNSALINPWTDWTTSNIPSQYVNYRQQTRIRATWTDDLQSPSYVLTGTFTITRGMPWVQVQWDVTNLEGLTCDMEFVPSGLFYLDSDQAILSSNLKYWNETTTPYSGNAWGGMEPWWTVGFTTNGTVYTSSKTSIFLNDTTYEDLDPLNYQAINGHSRAAYWVENFSSLPYQYNYTFLLSNLNTIAGWHYAELWVPQNVSALSLYTSADNGTTWTAGLKYNWTTGIGSGTFATSNGTSVNATIYDHGEPSAIVANVTTTSHADNSPTYEYSSEQGVYDRLAIGVRLQGDTGQNPLNSSSATFIKVQVFFNDSARYWFDDFASPEFTAEPGQGYGLLNQTDGKLSFITYGNATAPAWAIGMNQTMSHLRVTNYPNGSLENVLFAWEKVGMVDQSTFEFNTNILAFLSVNTTTYSLGDVLVPDIFEYGADNLQFQFHESLVQTLFWPMYTTLVSNQRRYELLWTQWLTPTEWNSPGNYTVALVQPSAPNGWSPLSTVFWLYIRSGSPVVSLIDGSYLGLDYVDFILTRAFVIPPGIGPPLGTTPPATTPSSTAPTPSVTLTPATTDTIIVIVVVIAIIIIAFLIARRKHR